MKEKLQQYALVAEIVSALAIVLSLIFVGLQVKQGSEQTAANTEAIRSQVQQSLMKADQDLLLFSASHPRTLKVDSLTEDNEENAELRAQRGLMFVAMLRTREYYWRQYRQGLLDEDTYISYVNATCQNIQDSKFVMSVWKELSGSSRYFPQDFIDELNARMQVFVKEHPRTPTTNVIINTFNGDTP